MSRRGEKNSAKGLQEAKEGGTLGRGGGWGEGETNNLFLLSTAGGEFGFEGERGGTRCANHEKIQEPGLTIRASVKDCARHAAAIEFLRLKGTKWLTGKIN